MGRVGETMSSLVSALEVWGSLQGQPFTHAACGHAGLTHVDLAWAAVGVHVRRQRTLAPPDLLEALKSQHTACRCGAHAWGTCVGRMCGAHVWGACVGHMCGTRLCAAGQRTVALTHSARLLRLGGDGV
eukprot:354768-Chlamydomonas_euryale.AAC.3